MGGCVFFFFQFNWNFHGKRHRRVGWPDSDFRLPLPLAQVGACSLGCWPKRRRRASLVPSHLFINTWKFFFFEIYYHYPTKRRWKYYFLSKVWHFYRFLIYHNSANEYEIMNEKVMGVGNLIYRYNFFVAWA